MFWEKTTVVFFENNCKEKANTRSPWKLLLFPKYEPLNHCWTENSHLQNEWLEIALLRNLFGNVF